MKKELWYFNEENNGTFIVDHAEKIPQFYFPLMNEAGMKASVTSELKGDLCTNFAHYLTVPVVTEDLHRVNASRNFWVCSKENIPWSVTGMNAAQKKAVWPDDKENYKVVGRLGVFETIRENKALGLKASTKTFVPINEDMVEVILVEIENTSDQPIEIQGAFAMPVFARHADNLRDHRQVTTMFQENHVEEQGVRVKPRIVHDEHGHRKSKTHYFIYGFDNDGNPPKDIWSSLHDFIGQGGNLDNPEALYKDKKPEKNQKDAVEAIGAFRFDNKTIKSGGKEYFIILSGIAQSKEEIEKWSKHYNTVEKVKEILNKTHEYWVRLSEKVRVKTADVNYDNWVRWIAFQVKCRQIFGNSYLPDFGYGRGGRGWRDLWQDLLSIFLVDPKSAREEIINNFKGVRIDGSNATIIGTKPGEFIADRNNVPRTWCDHGSWPMFVLNFYIQQTGDFDILFKKLPYWKDQFTHRSKKRDEKWNPKQGNFQKTNGGKVYEGTILEHVLLQQLSAFYHVGRHNNLLLEGADWNDTLDMARENGESVCFYHFYAGNLQSIVMILNHLKEKGMVEMELVKEIALLINDSIDYTQPKEKQKVLNDYFNRVQHQVSSATITLSIDDLIASLTKKSKHIYQHIGKNEWLKTKDGSQFFNGHYDNLSQPMHGDHPKRGLQLDLPSQVMAIMFNTATDEQIQEIYQSVKKHLKDQKEKETIFRLCTDFQELDLNIGRVTGFIYGEKEHGSKWIQQNIMLMYGLYKRGFVKEGYEVFNSIFKTFMNTNKTQVFPCLSSYINSDGKGAYNYLTGSGTWYLLTLTTQIFGVRGEKGHLLLEPKLVKEQFDKEGKVKIALNFREKRLDIEYHNKNNKDWNVYGVQSVKINHQNVDFIPKKRGGLIEIDTILKYGTQENNDVQIDLY